MKILTTLLVAVGLLFASCDSMKTNEATDLYGQWQGTPWSFTFNEDGSCVILNNGNLWPGETTWRAVSMGNALEFVADGKVIMANVTVKGLKDDVLTLETRPMIGGAKAELATQIHELTRVK